MAEATVEAKETPQENGGAPMKEMRSVTLSGFGGVRMLKVQKQNEPAPIEGEILIRVKACGMNFQDLMVRQGAVDNPPKTPFTMGFECAGEVESLGDNVQGFKIGDRVIAVLEYCAWAEAVVVPARYCFKMPKGMSFQDGAAMFMNYVTAYILLFDIGNLRTGQSVLLHSAGGGVGQAVIQLCRNIGDVTIFGTASSSKHEALQKQLDHVFDHTVDYCQEVKKISPDGVDLVLDCLCGEDTNKGISITKPLGKYVLFGTGNVITGETKSFFSFAKSWWQVDKISPVKLFEDSKSVTGFQLRNLLKDQNKQDYFKSIVKTLFDMYGKEKIRPVIDSTWAFEDVADAMLKMQNRQNIGKIILDPGLEPRPKGWGWGWISACGAGDKRGGLRHVGKPETSADAENEESTPQPTETADDKDKKAEAKPTSGFIPRLSNNPLSKLKNMLTSQDQGSPDPKAEPEQGDKAEEAKVNEDADLK